MILIPVPLVVLGVSAAAAFVAWLLLGQKRPPSIIKDEDDEE